MKQIVITFINIIFICSVIYAADNSNEEQNSLDKMVVDEQSDEQSLIFSEVWARPSSASNSVVYLNIKNNTNVNYTLIGASAISVANNVEIHQSYIDEKGISRMTSVDKILIPAQTDVEFKPGGVHIMLFDLKRKLNTGDKFKLNLSFETLGIKTVDVVVKDL